MDSGFNFQDIAKALEHESALREKIRDVVRDLEAKGRQIAASLNSVHATKFSDTDHFVLNAESQFEDIRASMRPLIRLMPQFAFYRYHDMFSRTLQSLAFSVLLVGWLKNERLVLKEHVSETIGIMTEDKDHFFLPTEDFLHACISLVAELARLSQNAVTQGDFYLPIRISKFCKEIAGGFALLNLKNDSLRRRYDSIKYEIKRIEEIVYDVTLRGLVKADEVETSRSKNQLEA